MITLDSPGRRRPRRPAGAEARAKAIVDGLGLRTVGDLLRPLPAPLPQDRRADPRRRAGGGPDAHGRRRDRRRARPRPTRTGAPGGRPTVSSGAAHRRPDAADDVLRQEAGHPARLGAPVRRGSSAGSSPARSAVPRQWQLTNPQRRSVRAEDGDEDAATGVGPRRDVHGLYPIYPLTKGLDSWDLQRAVTLRADRPRRPARAAARPTCGTEYDLLDVRTALRLDPRAAEDSARSPGPSGASASRRPWSPSWCWPGGAGGDPAPRAPRPAPADGGLLARVRRPAAVRADRRPARGRAR